MFLQTIQPKKEINRTPFNQKFKGDTKGKYTKVYHHKEVIEINNKDAFIYLSAAYPGKYYKYFKVPLADINYISENLLTQDNKINEILIRDKPLKPFLDLEIYFDEDKTDDENKTLLNNFMNHYKVIYEE
jgi:hypothetical protein